MADFYSESEDHLVEIRRALLKFEEEMGHADLDRESVEKLFRSFHSLKGICGMAGLHQAEQVSHRAEDFLRALSRGEMALTEEGLNVLIAVAQTLEEIIARHRAGQAAAETQPLLERLTSVAGTHEGEHYAQAPGSAGGYSPQVVARLQSARQQGRKILRCLFRPAPELDQRGINLNFVRAELQAVGEIIHAAPKVQPGGELNFEFLIAVRSESTASVPLKEAGIELIEVPAPGTVGTSSSNSSSAPETSFVAPSHFVRVELSRLDELMVILGDLVIHRARLEEALGSIANHVHQSHARRLAEITHGFSRDLRHLRDGLMRVRMVPIAEVFERLPFVIRDLSRETGKQVRLALHGQQTELDKYLVERLKDPLLHLMRNAVSHGIEEPGERIAIGKPAEGTVTLRASAAGETVVIEITDDGRGIDPEQVAERARTHGLAVPERLGPSELLDFICTPGFSTRDEADLASGRGIGMAVVRSTVLELGGEMELETRPGRGTTFRLRLPLTLAVADAIIVSAGGQRFAMPQASIQEITTVEDTAINRFEHNEVFRYRNGVLPLIRLTDVFGLSGERRNHFPVLVIGTGLNAVGILVDRVVGHREVVVRPVNDPLLKVPGISGATELGDGLAVLILDSISLTQTAKARRTSWKRETLRAL